MKEKIAKDLAKKIKKLPDDMKKKFMEKFYEKNKGHPQVDELCNQMKEMIGYDGKDYR